MLYRGYDIAKILTANTETSTQIFSFTFHFSFGAFLFLSSPVLLKNMGARRCYGFIVKAVMLSDRFSQFCMNTCGRKVSVLQLFVFPKSLEVALFFSRFPFMDRKKSGWQRESYINREWERKERCLKSVDIIEWKYFDPSIWQKNIQTDRLGSSLTHAPQNFAALAVGVSTPNTININTGFAAFTECYKILQLTRAVIEG